MSDLCQRVMGKDTSSGCVAIADVGICSDCTQELAQWVVSPWGGFCSPHHPIFAPCPPPPSTTKQPEKSPRIGAENHVRLAPLRLPNWGVPNRPKRCAQEPLTTPGTGTDRASHPSLTQGRVRAPIKGRVPLDALRASAESNACAQGGKALAQSVGSPPSAALRIWLAARSRRRRRDQQRGAQSVLVLGATPTRRAEALENTPSRGARTAIVTRPG